MREEELQSFTQQRNFRWVNGCAYGMAEEFPVLVRLNRGTKGNQVQIIFAIPAASYKEIKAELKQGLKGLAYHQMVGEDALMIGIPAKAESLEPSFSGAVNCVLSVCRQKGVKPLAVCPVCKGDGCDSIAHVGQCYRPVHKACLTENYMTAKAKAEENEINGNMLTGLLGAILGGIVGCIPSLFSIWAADKIYAIFYALIPLAIYYGYKIFKGRMNKAALAITIVLSVIFAVGIEFGSLAIAMVQEGIPLGMLGELLQVPEIMEMFWRNIPMSLIFIALGLWIAWSQITKTASTPVLGMEAALATLTPYHNGAPVQQEETQTQEVR